MNFKVKCIKSNPNVYEGITEGNIYEIVDGKFLDDNGMKRPVWKKVENFYEMLATYGGSCGCDFELVDDNVFSISDIKSCMLVELREGSLCMVMNTNQGKALVTEQGIVATLLNDNTYDKNLKEFDIGFRGFDIMKVWGLTSPDISQFFYITDNRPLLYKRKSEKVKMTLDEIEERLGVEIEIVQ